MYAFFHNNSDGEEINAYDSGVANDVEMDDINGTSEETSEVDVEEESNNNNDEKEDGEGNFDEPDKEPPNKNIIQLKLDSDDEDDYGNESDDDNSVDSTWSLASGEDAEDAPTTSEELKEANVGNNELIVYSKKWRTLAVLRVVKEQFTAIR